MTAPPTTVVIYGASGDLTQRKLIPALYNLFAQKRLPPNVRIVGTARRPYSDADFRTRMRQGVQQFSSDTFNDAHWEAFAPLLSYLSGNLNNPDDYTHLDKTLRVYEGDHGNRLYYLSTAPTHYATTIQCLAAAGMASEDHGYRRIIIEKPFGRSLDTAHELNEVVHAAFDEHQVYRIDHYLGKETAQNLMFFRFGNMVFENVWNRNFIDHVQITVAETVDVGHRAGFYDEAGVLRDMFQNHILQLLALIAMEPPASFKADTVRNETAKVFAALRPLVDEAATQNVVLGQYEGYCQAEGVAPGSKTATYAALRLFVDNWRWQGVPFYLRSGKALERKVSEVVIHFREPPHTLFPLPPGKELAPDVLSICIQPDEGIHFRFEAKVPGMVAETRSVMMTFHYADISEFSRLPEAYERLLLDALTGDATLFIRSDAIEMAWEFIDPILALWEGDNAPPIASYERGTWGPDDADALLAHNGHTWLLTCGNHD